MSEPEKTETAASGTSMTPGGLIDAATKADKNFRYAIVAAGLVSIVAIVARFGVNYATLLIGAVALVALMVLFLVFSQLVGRRSSLHGPALVLVWTTMAVTVAVLSLLLSSTFFGWPLPIKPWIVERMGADARTGTDRTDDAANTSVAQATTAPIAAAAPRPTCPSPGGTPGATGWVFYGVEHGSPTDAGKLVPPGRAAMPAFDQVRSGDTLSAQEGVRMLDGPAKNSRLIAIVEGGSCVRVLDGRKLYKAYGTYSGGWVCAQEASCPE